MKEKKKSAVSWILTWAGQKRIAYVWSVLLATILGELPDNDIYDFILLTVRENQLYEALSELKNNKSDTIVTMVNSLDSYKKWEDIEACSYPISGSKGYAYVAAVSPCHGSTDCRCIL